MVSRSLAAVFLSLLVAQTAIAVPTSKKKAEKADTDNKGEKGKEGWKYVEVGARNTEVSLPLFFRLPRNES